MQLLVLVDARCWDSESKSLTSPPLWKAVSQTIEKLQTGARE
jgi:hypothetical protein